MHDYQWPTVKTLPDYAPTKDWGECQILYESIEKELSQRFEVSAVLLPSARAGIASIFDYYGMSRNHHVFSPKYSSHCVWDVISRFSNPSTEINNQTDIVLAVHKWGYTHNYSCKTGAKIIEDSVDTIIQHGDTFPLKGEFEVLSLPKILGAYCGGVVLTHNQDYINQVKSIRLNNKALITHQSELKHRVQTGSPAPFMLPGHCETTNRGLDLFGLTHIQSLLSNFDLNLQTILARIECLNKYFGQELIKPDSSRLPCVFPARTSRFTTNQDTLFMQRQFNWSLLLDVDEFEPCWLLPLHMGVSDEVFNVMLKSMSIKLETTAQSRG